MVTCACNAYPTKAATVRKSAKKQNTKKERKAGKQIVHQVQYPAISEKTTQEAVQIPSEKEDKKKPDEPYKDVLKFLETGKVSLFKNKNYNVSVSIGLNLS